MSLPSRSRLALAGSLTTILIGLVGLAVTATRGSPLAFLFAEALVLGALFLASLNPEGRRRSGECVANDEGLWFNGKQLAAREQLSFGLIAQRGEPRGRCHLRLFDRAGRLSLDLNLEAEAARQILEALELTPTETVAVLRLSWHRLRSPWAAALVFLGAVLSVFALAGLLTTLGLHDDALAVLVALVAVTVGAPTLLRSLRVRLSIGSDGLLIERSLWGRRFVPYREIDRLQSWTEHHPASSDDGEGFDLILRSGAKIPLRTITQRRWKNRVERDFIAEMIEAATGRLSWSKPERLEVLARQDRSPRGWLGELRAMGARSGVGEYRSAALPEATLWKIVKNHGAEAEQRAAAAAVLAATPDKGELQEVLALAEAVANPPLREALRAIAEGDDPRLERSLGRLSS